MTLLGVVMLDSQKLREETEPLRARASEAESLPQLRQLTALLQESHRYDPACVNPYIRLLTACPTSAPAIISFSSPFLAGL